MTSEDDLVRGVKNGDPVSAGRLAVLCHCKGFESPWPQFELTELAIKSNNVDYLLSVADGLYYGDVLEKDRRSAKKFYDRARDINQVKACYCSGVAFMEESPNMAGRLLLVGVKAWHFASWVRYIELIRPKNKWLKALTWPIVACVAVVYLAGAIVRKSHPNTFWRYTDVSGRKISFIEEIKCDDEGDHFEGLLFKGE